MKKNYLLFLLPALFLTACGSKTAEEVAVENMLDGLQLAVKSQNVDDVLIHFTEDAKIDFDYPMALGGDMNIEIDEYGKMLKMAWAMPAEYAYEVSDINIVMSADGTQATVTDRVNESMSMQGQLIMSTETTETLEVEITDGIAKISRLHGAAEIDM